jgi:hypothetical protein
VTKGHTEDELRRSIADGQDADNARVGLARLLQHEGRIVEATSIYRELAASSDPIYAEWGVRQLEELAEREGDHEEVARLNAELSAVHLRESVTLRDSGRLTLLWFEGLFLVAFAALMSNSLINHGAPLPLGLKVLGVVVVAVGGLLGLFWMLRAPFVRVEAKGQSVTVHHLVKRQTLVNRSDIREVRAEGRGGLTAGPTNINLVLKDGSRVSLAPAVMCKGQSRDRVDDVRKALGMTI